MGGVAPGSPVSASNTNSAFLEKNADDSTIGKVQLANVDVINSGPTVVNTQGDINGLDTFLGRTGGSGPGSLPTWTNNDVGLSNNDVKTRADSLTQKFNSTTGHKHTGTTGDAPPLDYLTGLNGIQLSGHLVQETTLSGVTGTSWNVSTPLLTAVPSTSSTVEGHVVNAPVNIVQLFDAGTENALETPGGDKIYGRLTNTGGVGGTWTLTFFYLLVGVETSWNITSSTNIDWRDQVLYNETNRPVYSDQVVQTSNLLAGEIPDATTTNKGKVLLATATPQPVASAGATGTGPRVAMEDHAHAGVHSVKTNANAQILGDARFVDTATVSWTQSGNDLSANVQGFGKQTTLGFTLVDNTPTPTVIFTKSITSLSGLKIIYGIQRGSGNSRHSDFWISSDGSTVSYVDSGGTEQGTTGIVLSADISGGNFRLLYTSTNTGTSGTINLETTLIPS